MAHCAYEVSAVSILKKVEAGTAMEVAEGRQIRQSTKRSRPGRGMVRYKPEMGRNMKEERRMWHQPTAEVERAEEM